MKVLNDNGITVERITVERIVLTRESLSARRWRSWCEGPDCTEPSKEYWDRSHHYLEGWWKEHVRTTGHTVIIEEVSNAATVPANGIAAARQWEAAQEEAK
jgi:hypothetical protein